MNLSWKGLRELVTNDNFRFDLIVNYLKELIQYDYKEEFIKMYEEHCHLLNFFKADDLVQIKEYYGNAKKMMTC